MKISLVYKKRAGGGYKDRNISVIEVVDERRCYGKKNK